jgi:hypothetical protein
MLLSDTCERFVVWRKVPRPVAVGVTAGCGENANGVEMELEGVSAGDDAWPPEAAASLARDAAVAWVGDTEAAEAPGIPMTTNAETTINSATATAVRVRFEVVRRAAGAELVARLPASSTSILVLPFFAVMIPLLFMVFHPLPFRRRRFRS